MAVDCIMLSSRTNQFPEKQPSCSPVKGHSRGHAEEEDGGGEGEALLTSGRTKAVTAAIYVSLILLVFRLALMQLECVGEHVLRVAVALVCSVFIVMGTVGCPSIVACYLLRKSDSDYHLHAYGYME